MRLPSTAKSSHPEIVGTRCRTAELGDRVPLKHDEGVRQRNDPVDAAARHRVERGRDLGNAVHCKRL